MILKEWATVNFNAFNQHHFMFVFCRLHVVVVVAVAIVVAVVVVVDEAR